MSRRTLALVLALVLATPFAAQTRNRPTRPGRPGPNRSIPRPADPATPDTEGRHVNAHGGCILAHEGQWLWYGEARPDRGFTSLGVSLYTAPLGAVPSAADSVPASPLNLPWESRGVVLPVVDEEGSPIERGCIIERPKVLWNERDRQFVMLFHLELKGRGYEAAQTGFATSPTPEGPFRFHHAQRPNAGIWPANFSKKDIRRARALKTDDYPEWWTPAWRVAVEQGLLTSRDFASGQMSRDMTVFVDADGTAWHIFSSEENLTLQAAELTPDYLGYTGRYYRIAAGGQNEAPCIFRHDGLYWLICSGCTGWEPNEARMFSAPAMAGPWTQHPSPMQGPGAKRTFGAQGTWIWEQPAETPDASPALYFMADVWVPRALSISRHLCLPIRFDADGVPVVERP